MAIGYIKKRHVPLTGDEVRLYSGDFNFHGHVLAVFPRRYCKALKVAVENKDGIIELFDPRQLAHIRHIENETLFERYDD